MTAGPPASPDRDTGLIPAPVAALMYPAAQVDACIAQLEATIRRLQDELAEALRHQAEASVTGVEEVDEWERPPEAPEAAAPATSRNVVGEFLDALHDTGGAAPGSHGDQEGNSR